MIEKKVIRNYASCLFENINSMERLQKVLEQMRLLAEMLKTSELLRFVLYSPTISKTDKIKVILRFDEKFNFDEVLLQFFKVIIKNARFRILSEIIAEYHELIANSNGIKFVTLETPVKLSQKEIGVLQKYLENKLEKTIEFNIVENESLIGGVVMKYDSLLYDFSTIGAVNKFEKLLKETRS